MANASPESISRREVRHRLRELPKDRRKDVMSSIREGRAVRDPRDAPLAAALAERLSVSGRRWPWWVVPMERPRGWRAWLWVIHGIWIVFAFAFAYVLIVSRMPGMWRWVVLGLLVYTAITMPIMLRQTLRAYWNAPEAARRNKDVVRLGHSA